MLAAHNEDRTIADIVRGARAVVSAVVVVDDASTDRTAAEAEAAGATVVRHPKQKGYDGALKTGFTYAAERGFEYLATLDADGQHDPRLLESILLPLVEGKADVVVGYRPRPARVAEYIFALYASMQFGIWDPLCGMKGYRIALFDRNTPDMLPGSIGTGVALAMVRAGARLRQVPITIVPRKDASRFGGFMRANWRILGALWLAVRGPRKA